MPKITLCLWFDHQAEEAAAFYTGIFNNSKIQNTVRYTESGHEFHGKAAGSVMTVAFELDGQPFTALNGGPVFHFNEAISYQVLCKNQDEVDFYWQKLPEGGDVQAQQYVWLKDKYGVSWQILPEVLPKLLAGPDTQKAKRAMDVVLNMKKINLNEIKRIYER